MAPPSTNLPRMHNQSRTRAPLERSLNIVSQVFEKAVKPKKPSQPQMMRQYDLIERVKRYNPKTSEALLNRAYVYAMKAHGEQRRASGDPYFSHPLEVAAILTDLKLDDATIAAALLHDTIEDTTATRAEIDQMFGNDIGALVVHLDPELEGTEFRIEWEADTSVDVHTGVWRRSIGDDSATLRVPVR